jgi:hypothetical protein
MHRSRPPEVAIPTEHDDPHAASYLALGRCVGVI